MTPKELERIAYTVECFFNATRTEDSAERAAHEERLVRWFHAHAASKPSAIYQDGNVFCYMNGRMGKSFALGGDARGKTIWCDGRKISLIDGKAFSNGGALVMLGTTGLILTMPGAVGAHPGDRQHEAGFELSFDGSDSSNNNNNNNTNNNTNG